MIRFPCDRCEKTLAVEDQFAGEKVECPHCGDMNVVPLAPPARPPGQAVEAPAGPGEVVEDERKLLFVRPSLLRPRPVLSLLLGIGPFALAAGLQFAATKASLAVPAWAWWVGAPLIGWSILLVIWLRTCMTTALEVTNRRTTLIKGLVLRDRRDVFHRDVQSVTIPERSIYQRMLNVGDLLISSDEESGAEIRLERLANPSKTKGVIDQFVGRRR